MLHLFLKPFPQAESRFEFLRLLIYLSLFVTFFLLVFQPFGIHLIEEYKVWICLGFGGMTLLGGLAFELTIGQLMDTIGFRKKWTFYKWLLYNMGATLLISVFNFLFIRFVFFGFIQWDLFPAMLYGTFMIGSIPFVVLGGIYLNREEAKVQNISQEINEKNAQPTEVTSMEEDIKIFGLPAVQIRYVEALQNYIRIGFINAEGKQQEQVERATLKQFEEQAIATSIVRCHRSFMVNRSAIISTSGNAQGLLLTLTDCNKVIPVARSRVKEFR